MIYSLRSQLRSNDREILTTCMTNEVLKCAKFIHDLTQQYSGKADGLIRSHEAVQLLKCIKVIDSDIQQSPVLVADDTPELFLNQFP